MSEAGKSSDTGSENGVQDGVQDGARHVGATMVSGAQDAAVVVRNTAEQVAAKLPDAMANAQVAARDTQKVLDAMPNQALVIGTSFSLGLGVGLFLSGANRFLVALALAPAGAMLMTMMGRDEGQSKNGSSSTTRRSASRTQ